MKIRTMGLPTIAFASTPIWRRLVVVCLAIFPLLACPSSARAIGGTKTISVRIFVDEEEPRIVKLWQETLARRLDQASTILSMYGSIRFSVTKFSEWDSDDTIVDFPSSLKEFEQEAKPDPAELSIGFTSQYKLKRGRSNLGGTRGPMRKHILIREGAPRIEEVERLEVLVHELAHYLGAAHSGNQNSVMRPVLGDGRSRARSFRILLDDPNAEIVKLISAEMASRNVQTMHQLTIPTREKIRDEYRTLAKEFPDDDVAKTYASLIDRSIRVSVTHRQRVIEAKRKKAAAASAAGGN